MAGSAKEFLERWRETSLYAEAPGFGTLENVVEECIRDGKAEGHSEEQLRAAADGSLEAYVASVIKKASGK